MFKTLLTNQQPGDAAPLSSAQLDKLAREKKFIQRTSHKTSASGFVMSMFASVINGKSSLANIGSNFKDYGDLSISKQAAHQRIKQSAVNFMEATTAAILADKFKHDLVLSSKLFERVLIEDASLSQMHPANSKAFRGHGNKKGDTAAFKIDFCYDLLSGLPVTANKVGAYSNDKKAGSTLVNEHLQKGDLCMRDLGYFKIADFLEIQRKGAYWLSKIPTNVKIERDGKDLNDELKATKLNTLERNVTLAGGKLKCRLIATRATAEQAEQMRRKANQQARNHGKTPRKDASLRNGWHIIVTNINKKMMDRSQLTTLYRVRWQIETSFKAWKQSTKLKECFNKQSNVFHQKCLIQASFILLILTMRAVVELQPGSKKWISIRKVATKLTKHLLRQRNMEELELFDPDLREITMETRDRENLMIRAKECLT